MKAGDKVKQKGLPGTKVYRICSMDANTTMLGKWSRCVIYAIERTSTFFVMGYDEFIEKFELCN